METAAYTISFILTVIICFGIPLLLIVWLIYQSVYYKSQKFLSIKERISSYTNDCNALNEHIETLKDCYSEIQHIDYGQATFVNNSKWNYRRPAFNARKQSKFVYNCSRQVCNNAQNQPFKYLCKYFNIKPNENTLEMFESVLNKFSAVEQGKQLLVQQRNDILAQIQNDIPKIIMKFSRRRLLRKLGFQDIDLSNMYFPKYTFQYTSSGGNSSFAYDIVMDIPNLEKFVQYLSDTIKFKKSAAGQRALMTPALRESIKQRDHYTCQKCGVSVEEEPHLLLEIDHIVPISKGGMTSVDNLQTLCWKCNRSKGARLLD